jgi:hypothetical protein
MDKSSQEMTFGDYIIVSLLVRAIGDTLVWLALL